MRQIRIGLVQMQAYLGETWLNLQKMVSFVAEARNQRVDIICFPEMCIQGYNRPRAGALAEPVPGPSTTFLSQLAREKGLIIIAGMAEKSATDRPYVTQVVAFPDRTLGKYRKTHLGKSEQPYFTPGDDLPVFIRPKASFGIAICWDLHFPEVTAILSMRGSEIIFAPHASPAIVTDRRGSWLKYLAARAYDNSVFVAACNLVGGNGEGQGFCGGAIVLDPRGNVVAEDFSGSEGLLVAELEPNLINTIRRQQGKTMRDTFFLKARRPELYGDLVRMDYWEREDHDA
ncbi:MAG: nitrilase family protein [Bacillota bacterium]